MTESKNPGLDAAKAYAPELFDPEYHKLVAECAASETCVHDGTRLECEHAVKAAEFGVTRDAFTDDAIESFEEGT